MVYPMQAHTLTKKDCYRVHELLIVSWLIAEFGKSRALGPAKYGLNREVYAEARTAFIEPVVASGNGTEGLVRAKS
jgi:hypothetical protein